MLYICLYAHENSHLCDGNLYHSNTLFVHILYWNILILNKWTLHLFERTYVAVSVCREQMNAKKRLYVCAVLVFHVSKCSNNLSWLKMFSLNKYPLRILFGIFLFSGAYERVQTFRELQQQNKNSRNFRKNVHRRTYFVLVCQPMVPLPSLVFFFSVEMDNFVDASLGSILNKIRSKINYSEFVAFHLIYMSKYSNSFKLVRVCQNESTKKKKNVLFCLASGFWLMCPNCVCVYNTKTYTNYNRGTDFTNGWISTDDSIRTRPASATATEYHHHHYHQDHNNKMLYYLVLMILFICALLCARNISKCKRREKVRKGKTLAQITHLSIE